MQLTGSLRATLHRFLTRGITTSDIASALLSFDETTRADEVARVAKERRLTLFGVRKEGIVTGYATIDDFAAGLAHKFDDGLVLEADAPLADVVLALEDKERIFVSVFGEVGAIVTRRDLEKPPVRMWLFGCVTLLESAFNRLLTTRYPRESWQQELSENRLEKARALWHERVRRGEIVSMVDCLQFSEKGYVLVKNPDVRALLDIPSRKAGDKFVKEFERLRNRLAHSQPILEECWEMILLLARHVDRLSTLLEIE